MRPDFGLHLKTCRVILKCEYACLTRAKSLPSSTVSTRIPRRALRLTHPETRKRHLGEIYLNRDILAKSPERAAPLLTHGILHLLGYDHVAKKDAVAMESVERKIVKAL